MLISSDVRILAVNAWNKYGRRTISTVRCLLCRQAWRENGTQVNQEPPVWPPDWEGRICPTCGSIMSSPCIPV